MATQAASPSDIRGSSLSRNAAPICLEGVSKSFDGSPVLRDLDVTVEPGERLVVIGESGCGKSVTLKLMMSLLTPTSGRVTWAGEDVGELSAAERDRQRLQIGYLFQNAALFDSLDVCENVAFGLRESGINDEVEVRETVFQRLEEVGLGADIVGRRPEALSGGMKKRVALARALALEPAVMLYDEPTTGLDPVMAGVINRLIVSVSHSRPMTSVVVTHDMSTIQTVADRVVMLEPVGRLAPDEPQVIFSGSLAEGLASADPRVRSFLHGEALELERKAG